MANKFYSSYFKRLIKKHDPLVKDALDAMILAGIEQYETIGQIGQLPIAEMTTALTNLHLDSGLRWARYTAKDIAKYQQKKSVATDNYEAFIREYLNRHLLSRSVIPIEETQRKIMSKIIADGVADGLGPNKIANKLKELIPNRNRAKLIVRTETGRAMNTGAMFAAASSDVVVRKVWDSAKDKRTRRIPEDATDHLRMDGISVPFNEPFFIPGTRGFEALMFPCDPQGSGMNVINCRCAVSFVPTGEIRKPLGGNEFSDVVNFVQNNLSLLIVNLANNE